MKNRNRKTYRFYGPVIFTLSRRSKTSYTGIKATRPTENVGEIQADYLFEKFRRSDYLKSVVHVDQL